MPMFILLERFTDEGVKNIPAILDSVKENQARGQKLGLTLHGWYLTQGHYDLVVVVEAPDAETALKQTVAVAGTGMVRSETLRAYTLDEAQQLLS